MQLSGRTTGLDGRRKTMCTLFNRTQIQFGFMVFDTENAGFIKLGFLLQQLQVTTSTVTWICRWLNNMFVSVTSKSWVTTLNCNYTVHFQLHSRYYILLLGQPLA